MNNVNTDELLECYKKVLEYLKQLEGKKEEVEKGFENVE